jgi:hypothetical protein
LEILESDYRIEEVVNENGEKENVTIADEGIGNCFIF